MGVSSRQVTRTLRQRIRAARLERPDPHARARGLRQLLARLPPAQVPSWPWWVAPLAGGLLAAWVLQRH